MGIRELSKSKKNKKPKHRKIVLFDEEIITKDSAVKHLAESESALIIENKETDNVSIQVLGNSEGKVKRNKKANIKNNANVSEHPKNKRKSVTAVGEKSNDESNVEKIFSTEIESKKRKKNKKLSEQAEPGSEENEEVSVEKHEIKKAESIRAPIIENKETDNASIQVLGNSERKVKRNKEANIKNNANVSEHPKNKRKSVTAVGEKSNDESNAEKNFSTEIESKKRKKNKKLSEQTEPGSEENEEVSVEKPEIKKAESIRAQKRAKHAKLLEEKKLKAVVDSQQSVLNYLSMWKHTREEWKFQKLKQIWLQQNLFDSSKIPNEFWETAVEYFSSSKGFIRNCVLRDALKIIEKEESSEEENTDENHLLVLNRARDIVQNLQE